MPLGTYQDEPLAGRKMIQCMSGWYDYTDAITTPRSFKLSLCLAYKRPKQVAYLDTLEAAVQEMEDLAWGFGSDLWFKLFEDGDLIFNGQVSEARRALL